MVIEPIIKKLNAQIRRSSDKVERCELLLQLVKHLNENNNTEIKKQGKVLLDLAHEVKSNTHLAWCYYHLGDFDKKHGNFDQAKEEINKCMILFKEQKDIYGLASAHNAMGNILDSQDRYDLSIKHYKASIRYGAKLGNKIGLAICLNNIGLVQTKKGEYRAALDSLNKALPTFEDMQFKPGLIAVRDNIGVIHAKLGNYPKALSYYLSSLKLSEEIGNVRGIANSYTCIGDLYYTQREYDLSMQNYTSCLKVRRQTRDIRGIAESHNNIGLVYQQRNHFLKARYNLLLSVKYARETNYLYCLSSAYINLGGLYFQKSDFKLSLEYYHLALNASTQIGHKECMSDSMIHIGICHTATKSYSAGEKFIVDGLTLARNIGHKGEEKKALHALYELTKAQQLWEKALEYYELYTQIGSKLQNEASSQKIAELQVSHDVEMRQKEAELYKQKGTELENRNKLIQLEKRQAEISKKLAEESEQRKRIFLRNMSHEIRTPMNAIIGLSEMLKKRVSDEKSIKYLDAIRFSGENLIKVINEVIDISQIEEGKLRIHNVDYNLRAEVQMIEDLLRPGAEEKKLDLQVHIDDKLPDAISGDPYRLNQVLINLIGNAIKYTASGSVVLNIRVNADRYISIEVKDTGKGIPVKDQKSIFNSYKQLPLKKVTPAQSTGLGLSISQQLVSLMGGKLELKSTAGKGSNFYFTLPLKKATLSSPIKPETPPKITLDSLKVLIADDNALNREILSDMLIDNVRQLELKVAENGREVLEKLKLEDFDLIIMDMQMPVMGGLDATRAIRNLASRVKRRVPIIAVTAGVIASEQKSALKAGVNEYIGKPHTSRELLLAINKYISGSQKTTLPDLDTVNLSELVSFCREDFRKMHKYIELFIRSLEKNIPELKNSSETRDTKKIKRLIHILKPQLKFIGVVKASDYLLSLENDISIGGNWNPATQKKVLGLIRQLKSTQKELSMFVKENNISK